MPTTTSTDATRDAAPRFGLPRTARVTRNRDFSRIYARGLRAGGKHLIVVALPNEGGTHRLGLSVGKIHGCAVIRNKIKRVFREAFRLERPTLPGSFDLVLIPRQRPGKYLLAEVRAELRRLVERIARGDGRRPAKRGGRRR